MKLVRVTLLDRDGDARARARRGAARRVLLAGLMATAVLASTRSAEAEPVSQPEGLAFGLTLGWPMGVTMKHWLGGSNAWDLGVGVGPGLRLHADFLFGIAQVLSDTSDLTLDLYIGGGPIIGVTSVWCGRTFAPTDKCDDGRVFAGVRVPVGIDFRLRETPLEFGVEVAPGLWFAPSFFSGLLDAFVFVRFVL